MTDRLRAALRIQAQACAGLGSPFMARLCTLLAERLAPDRPLTRRLFDWPGDLSPSGASVPLRLAGALHALVLRGDANLCAVYPPNAVDDHSLWLAVEAALTTHAAFVHDMLDSPPQTNEVRRSAVLIAAGHWLAQRYGLPFVCSELGASAGLNLQWDRYALVLPGLHLGPRDAVLTLSPRWTGSAPPKATISVIERAGVDLNPIDIRDPAQRLRLRAYLWPDQPERRILTDRAIAAAPLTPDCADAIDWLEPRLKTRLPSLTHPRHGTLHLIWTTIAWQYFPPATQDRGRAMIEEAGARATPDTPMAWLSYEADGHSPGAALTLRLWPGAETLSLGRADFHGRWVDWTPP